MPFAVLQTLVYQRIRWALFESATPNQVRTIARALAPFFPNREDRLALTGALVGRLLDSTYDLTRGEASAIIDVFFPNAPDDWTLDPDVADTLQTFQAEIAW